MVTFIRRIVTIAFVAITVSACAFTPHEINLQPMVALTGNSERNGTRLFFRFVDDRPDINVGTRAVGNNGARISATKLPQVVEDQLREGLIKKGYQLTQAENGADAQAVFRLRAFTLSLEQGFFSGGQNENAVIAVDASRGMQTYSQVYRYNQEQRVQVVPTEREIDTVMNNALSDVLRQALSDGQLDSFLSSRGPGI